MELIDEGLAMGRRFRAWHMWASALLQSQLISKRAMISRPNSNDLGSLQLRRASEGHFSVRGA
jgi:hypothetical protein